MMLEAAILTIIQLVVSYLTIYTAIAIGQQSSEKKLEFDSRICRDIGSDKLVGNLVTRAVVEYVGDYTQVFECQSMNIDIVKFTTPSFSAFLYTDWSCVLYSIL